VDLIGTRRPLESACVRVGVLGLAKCGFRSCESLTPGRPVGGTLSQIFDEGFPAADRGHCSLSEQNAILFHTR